MRNADGTFTRQAFPGNRIPSNRINPIATNMLSYLPLPNLPGSAANLFLLSPTPIDKDYYSVRIDYYISQTRRLAGRFTKDNLDWQFANFFNSIADADGRKILIPRENAFLSYSDTLAPTLLLDGRIGFSHQTEAFTTPSEGLDITTLGFPASLLQQSQSTPSGKQGLFPSTTVADMASMATSTSVGQPHGIGNRQRDAHKDLRPAHMERWIRVQTLSFERLRRKFACRRLYLYPCVHSRSES